MGFDNSINILYHYPIVIQGIVFIQRRRDVGDVMEKPVDLSLIQVLLEHAGIKTSPIYIQMSSREIGRNRSPLDFLGNKNEHLFNSENNGIT